MYKNKISYSIVNNKYIISTESFRKFDYDDANENLQLYGSTQPPMYNLEKVKVPVAIFYSDNDFLTHHTVSSLFNKSSL